MKLEQKRWGIKLILDCEEAAVAAKVPEYQKLVTGGKPGRDGSLQIKVSSFNVEGTVLVRNLLQSLCD